MQRSTDRRGRAFYLRWGKRWLDVAVAAVSLVLLAPVMAVIAVLVRLRLGAPVLFRHVRCGLGGGPFTIAKFRTMTDARDENGDLLPDGERLTGLGRFLRATSLDELPELVNVLKGDMSLVGPRPLSVDYADRYSAEQARRHEVKPGITGWAQVNGRNATTWTERFRLDVWYVDHCSFGLDVRILAGSVPMVLAGGGVSAEGYATMPEFMGTEGRARRRGNGSEGAH